MNIKLLIIILLCFSKSVMADWSSSVGLNYLSQDMGGSKFLNLSAEKKWSNNFALGILVYGTQDNYVLENGVAHEGYGGLYVGYTINKSNNWFYKLSVLVGFTSSMEQEQDFDFIGSGGSSYGVIYPKISLGRQIFNGFSAEVGVAMLAIPELNNNIIVTGISLTKRF
jgi:hypothetical protein